MPFPQGSGLNQLTGDVTAGPGTGSQAATLIGTASVNTVVSDLQTIATNVTRRSATATALSGECTVFTGSTGGQTITLPTPGSNAAVYRIVNDANVAVSILGGANSLSIAGTIYSASTPFSVGVGVSYDFVFDQTGIWQCMSSANTGGGLTSSSAYLTTAQLTMTLAATPYNITSLSLVAGTYLITASVRFIDTNAATDNLSVWIGPNSASTTGLYAAQGCYAGSNAGAVIVGSLSFTAIVVLASTTTVYLNSQCSGAGAKIDYSLAAGLAANVVTGITAVKIV